jgi:hypothetical protein
MIGYAQLRPGRGFEFRRAVPYYLQRVVTWHRTRRSVSRCLAAAIRLRQGGRPKGTASPYIGRTVAALERDGLAMLGDLIAPAAIEEMVTFFRGQEVVGPGGRLIPLSDLPPGTGMAAYPLESVVACPGLMKAINTPDILRIVSDYLGCKPTISSLGVRWSFPSAAHLAETQAFHRDPDDWRFVKLFIYLTDVDAGAGPHAYVVGSHDTPATLRARPYPRESLERRFGTESIRTITGPAGTTFMADTYGIHMGEPPQSRPRLILQVQYSILPIFAFEYRPIAASAGMLVDTYVNRLLIL